MTKLRMLPGSPNYGVDINSEAWDDESDNSYEVVSDHPQPPVSETEKLAKTCNGFLNSLGWLCLGCVAWVSIPYFLAIFVLLPWQIIGSIFGIK
jgi:hypothetical protein